jgi:hypothetical protein
VCLYLYLYSYLFYSWKCLSLSWTYGIYLL